jgi:hypothetical protein
MSTLVSLDCGNANIKVVSETTRVSFPHALRELSAFEVQELAARDAFDASPNLWQVNHTWYEVGTGAIQRSRGGSAVYGESRYVSTYYGVLAAIAAASVLDTSSRSVLLYGSHTPKDAAYRGDMSTSVVGKWTVSNLGVTKTLNITDFRSFDEPAGAYRHATLDDNDTPGYWGNPLLRKGRCLVLDIGGFTTAYSTAEEGKIVYDMGVSHNNGMLDVLTQFEQLIRTTFRDQLKGSNFLEPLMLREALHTGVYNARGRGTMKVLEQAAQAREVLLKDIRNYFHAIDLLGRYDILLLAGGGSVTIEKAIRQQYGERISIEVAEKDRANMHFGTALGGMKMLKLLRSRGKL